MASARKGGLPRAPRRRRSPEETRAELLSVAEELLVARGPDGVSLADIARAAGVTHPLLVHYFGGYEGVVRAVLRARNQRIVQEVAAAMKDTGTAVGAGALLQRVLTVLRDPRHGRLLAWALLTRRSGRAAPMKGGQLAMLGGLAHERLVLERGDEAPPRAEVEDALTLALCAALGFVVAQDALGPALERTTEEVAVAFERALTRALQALGVDPVPAVEARNRREPDEVPRQRARRKR